MHENSNYSKYFRKLSIEEEEKLYNDMRDGCIHSREQLILAHSYLVVSIAKKYAKYGEQQDLEQEGMRALILACDKYDLEKGRLRAYAARRIKTALLRYLDKTRHIVKLPTPQVNELLVLLRLKEEIEEEMGREPGYHDLLSHEKVIAAHKKYSKQKSVTKFTIEEYVKLLVWGDPVTSLNKVLHTNEDESETELQDIIPDPTSRNKYNDVDIKDVTDKILEGLTAEEKFILKSVAEEKTGREIGAQLGITTQTVSKFKIKLVNQIQKRVRNNKELKLVIGSLGFSTDEVKNEQQKVRAKTKKAI